MNKFYQYKNEPAIYEHVGHAKPAGEARNNELPSLEVYRDIATGEVYYRYSGDFNSKMTPVDAPVIPIWLEGGPDVKAMSCCEVCCKKAIQSDARLMFRRQMILCPNCGNKRCPKAADHRNKCTGSNAVGQVGEIEQ